MSVTFFSGFSNKIEAFEFIAENIFTGFQVKNKICVAFKNSEELGDFNSLRDRKFFETKKIEFLCIKNLSLITEQIEEGFDEIHIFSDKILDLNEVANENTFVYTLQSDEEINNASRKLYANLKDKGINVIHEAV